MNYTVNMLYKLARGIDKIYCGLNTRNGARVKRTLQSGMI